MLFLFWSTKINQCKAIHTYASILTQNINNTRMKTKRRNKILLIGKNINQQPFKVKKFCEKEKAQLWQAPNKGNSLHNRFHRLKCELSVWVSKLDCTRHCQTDTPTHRQLVHYCEIHKVRDWQSFSAAKIFRTTKREAHAKRFLKFTTPRP